ncbi:hypothetical protein H696_02410 [Fonticula alba]|uniref:2-(3-amino-3-carboxypropyl)histidine synthase subunit 1 n=1 Tax=Fonticula alba TaxID=691883 RepID=A0A058ZAP3_FONAL|nr:hypothetical protein H696_02410 [Fonticula alba]KCV71464.1 hypothetical protein H696_02410 [Fonticula alba]|eukprot:XP_009494587.1 hypothetical protein H696_02410 [Fonticula alba]
MTALEDSVALMAIEDIGGASVTKKPSAAFSSNLVPEEILNDEELNAAIQQLPTNYNFEIHKTVWRLRRDKVKRVGMQFPEGLMMYACPISDILERFCDVTCVILGDVTYGACCIDDFSAMAAGCDFLLHYGHSCLVPIDVTGIITMYIFVDISVDVKHFIETVRLNFPPQSKLAFVGTVQFLASLSMASKVLADEFQITVPQSRPLSPGELLGCTAPRFVGLKNADDTVTSLDAMVYLADGRFHLEAAMIANPELPAFRYDPYAKSFTREYYEVEEMHSYRKQAIERAKTANHFGIILGTLGRQGSPKVVEKLKTSLTEAGKTFTVVLLSEIMPKKLAMFRHVDACVACPRLSIDWGYSFDKPLLTPYELHVTLDQIAWQAVYPMDFYARGSLGPWTPNHVAAKDNQRTGKRPFVPPHLARRKAAAAAAAAASATTPTTDPAASS